MFSEARGFGYFFPAPDTEEVNRGFNRPSFGDEPRPYTYFILHTSKTLLTILEWPLLIFLHLMDAIHIKFRSK